MKKIETEDQLLVRRKGAGAELVYSHMKHTIIEGLLAESAPIDERQLIERFGVSRTPVREAMTRLAAEGLIELRPNRSALVAPAAPSGLLAYCDARTRVAAAVARFAALRRKAVDISELEAKLAAVASGGEPTGPVLRAAFRVLAQAAANRYLETEHDRLIDTGTRICALAGCLKACRELTAEWLLRIGSAVIRGDADEAEALARAQVKALCETIEDAQQGRHENDP